MVHPWLWAGPCLRSSDEEYQLNFGSVAKFSPIKNCVSWNGAYGIPQHVMLYGQKRSSKLITIGCRVPLYSFRQTKMCQLRGWHSNWRELAWGLSTQKFWETGRTPVGGLKFCILFIQPGMVFSNWPYWPAYSWGAWPKYQSYSCPYWLVRCQITVLIWACFFLSPHGWVHDPENRESAVSHVWPQIDDARSRIHRTGHYFIAEKKQI